MAQKRFVDKTLAEGEKNATKERLIEFNGGLYPAMVCRPETLKILDTFEARSDDVILVGYPKTGTNWVGQILTELEAASGKYDEEEKKQRQQKEKEITVFPYLEFGDPEKFERMKKLPSRRVIKTHLVPEKIPKSIFQKKAKILVLFRNPKDNAVSYFHFSKAMSLCPSEETWNKFFPDYITGNVPYGLYFDHIIGWNNYLDDKNVMFITYEEIQENGVLALKRIAEFFNFSVSEQEIQSIVEKTSFKSMKDNALLTHGEIGKNFFRKGIVGDWKNTFSASQNEEMDKKFEEKAAKTKLGIMLKYEEYCKD